MQMLLQMTQKANFMEKDYNKELIRKKTLDIISEYEAYKEENSKNWNDGIGDIQDYIMVRKEAIYELSLMGLLKKEE